MHMADEHGLLSNSLLSDAELLVELARARKEAEQHSCPGLAGRPHADAGADAGECACARMHELEREVVQRLATRGRTPAPVRRAG